MTEEDQLLVTRAALAGARFEPVGTPPRGWRDVGRKYINTRMYTLGRAAAHVLHDMGEMSDAEYNAYLERTLPRLTTRWTYD